MGEAGSTGISTGEAAAPPYTSNVSHGHARTLSPKRIFDETNTWFFFAPFTHKYRVLWYLQEKHASNAKLWVNEHLLLEPHIHLRNLLG